MKYTKCYVAYIYGIYVLFQVTTYVLYACVCARLFIYSICRDEVVRNVLKVNMYTCTIL